MRKRARRGGGEEVQRRRECRSVGTKDERGWEKGEERRTHPEKDLEVQLAYDRALLSVRPPRRRVKHRLVLPLGVDLVQGRERAVEDRLFRRDLRRRVEGQSKGNKEGRTREQSRRKERQQKEDVQHRDRRPCCSSSTQGAEERRVRPRAAPPRPQLGVRRS